MCSDLVDDGARQKSLDWTVGSESRSQIAGRDLKSRNVDHDMIPARWRATALAASAIHDHRCGQTLNLVGSLPRVEAGSCIRSNDEKEFAVSPAQRCQRVSCVGRSTAADFDVGHIEPIHRIKSHSTEGESGAGRCDREYCGFLPWIVGHTHQDVVEVQAVPYLLSYRNMAMMGRIKGATKDTDSSLPTIVHG